MTLGRRQLFIYWRVARAELPPARQALRGWHAALQAEHAALQCRLFLRGDGDAPEATVMETYALQSAGEGIDRALQRQIEHGGNVLLQRWLHGARHVEAFDACDG